MNAKAYTLFLCSLLVSLTAQAAQTVPARMYCLSIRVYDGVNSYGDILRISSTGDTTGLEELPPSQTPDSELTLPGTISYGSQMWLWDNQYSYWNNLGTFYLNPPGSDQGFLLDANNNRYPDFFEVSRAFTTSTSSGSYSYYDPQVFDYFSGNITAQWSRSAGSKTGTCRMAFSDPYWGTFISTFEIIEYKGTLTYTPGATNVTGTLNLTQTGSNATFQGSVAFIKSDTNRFDSLIIQPGTLTDESATAHYYTNRYFFRDSNWPTNYAGYIAFDNDYDVYSFYPYATWVLSIDDPNDSNANGIPNFSDDATVVTPPNPPALALTPTTTNLLLSISGTTQHSHQVQQTSSLNPISWQDVGNPFILTNPTVLVPLIPSGSGPTFWRVVAQ